jgi:hypothetical protein
MMFIFFWVSASLLALHEESEVRAAAPVSEYNSVEVSLLIELEVMVYNYK